MPRKLLRIALVSLVGLTARTATAERLLPGATLSVHRPASLGDCVDEGQLERSILAQLTSLKAPLPTDPRRQIDVTISEEPTGFVAVLRLAGQSSGLRRLEASRCEGLADALAITLAMILDGDALTPRSTHETLPEKDSTEPERDRPVIPKTSSLPSEVRTERKSPPSSKSFSGISLPSGFALSAWMGGGFGSFGSFNVESGVSLLSTAWTLEVGAFYQPSKAHDLGDGTVRLMTLGGLAAGCLRHGNRWRALFCVRTMIGGERVTGTGFAKGVEPQILPVVSLGPSLGVETGSRFVFGFHLLGQIGFIQDDYFVENRTDTLKMPLATAWLVARVALASTQPRPRFTRRANPLIETRARDHSSSKVPFRTCQPRSPSKPSTSPSFASFGET